MIGLQQIFSLQTLFACLVGGVVALFIWAFNRSQYWKRLGLPNVPGPLFFGNFKSAFFCEKCSAEMLHDVYSHPNSQNKPFVGMHIFHKPAMVLRDPGLIKTILNKDFNHFSNRHAYTDPKSDLLGTYNLFLVRNPLWRQIRQRLTPMFTSGKMKQMFSLVSECGVELDEHLCSQKIDATSNSFKMEIKDICARYTTDVIASCAYGVQANSISNPNAEFRKHGKLVFDFTVRRAIELMCVFFLPEAVQFFRFKVFCKETTEFMRKAIGEVIAQREKIGNTRNDLIDILVSLKNDDKAKKENNMEEAVFKGDMLVAQASVFLTAGFETTSSTISFALYEISKKPFIQERIREEIRQILIESDGKLTYDNVYGMPYLTMVINETLRMYPSLPFLDRICTSEEGYNMGSYGDFTIPPGMPIFIPSFSIHRDPQYFPKPHNFDPERFSPEAGKISDAFTPFGSGPHSCIGERFGMMKVKIGLANFLRNHYVTPCDTTPSEMKLDPKALLLAAKGGIDLNVVRAPLVLNE